jgi:hypothetical protein
MGFYGNIKNTSRTQFSFDKVYANRAEMDNMAALDGIYAGRFVLIEYDKAATPSSFPIGFMKDRIVYTAIPNTYNANVTPYQLAEKETDPNTGKEVWKSGGHYVTPGTIIRIPVNNNFDKIYYTDSGLETEEPRDIYLVVSNISRPKANEEIRVPKYHYDADTNTLHEVHDKEGNLIDHAISYVEMGIFNPNTNSAYVQGGSTAFPNEDMTASAAQNAYGNYIFNYNVDRTQYGVARGYDSTVWQKVYENSAAKYVMVAELNSVVPTFDIAADAPTTVPVSPHFDVDSTNVYYKLHWQPQWGFRVKASQADQMTPELLSSGDMKISSYMPTRRDERDYPSDVATTWTNQIYNPNNGQTTERVFITDDGNKTPSWIDPKYVFDNKDQIPAAIYFNKAGFDSEKITYSHDKEYRNWKNNLVTDEISITPTGFSGHSYNIHGQRGVKEPLPDTQELSIMLPSIGDSMAEIWDLIYGGRNLDPAAKIRNRDVSWYNAKAVTNKSSVRLINTLGPGRYSYNPKAASTVAGILNSAQDLMGMIITDEMPDDVASANGDYIYYDKETQKYYFKHKTYEFEDKNFPNNRIPDDYDPYTPATLKAWDKKYYYIDTATKAAWEFIMEDKFYPDRKYLKAEDVEGSMLQIGLSAEYKPDGTFFTLNNDIYPNGIGYRYFTGSFETFDATKNYYQLKKADRQIADNEAIYVPNTYYYVDYELVQLTDITYEPGVYYFVGGVDAAGTNLWTLAEGVIMSDNVDFLGNPVTAYYKRKYNLGTHLTKQDCVYYRVLPDANQSSNAYYKQNKYADEQADMTFDRYIPGKYYVRVGSKEETEGYTYEIIENTYYILDPSVYENETAFNAAGKTYYSIRIEYELVQGKDVIEITDENAIKIDFMRDITEFQSGDFYSGTGQDVFYVFVDSEGATRYIEVNYNNFDKAYNPVTQKYEFIVMDYALVGEPYAPNLYYYRVTDPNSNKNGSFLIDNSANIVEGRTYYEFTQAPGIDYSGEFLTGYYAGNEFWVESPPGSGVYIPAEDEEFDQNKEYLDPTLKLYVKSDGQGIYDIGAEWPMTIKNIPNDVQLATRKDVWELKELPSFGDKLITLHGLLLKLYKHIDETDELTRDTTTARGSINQFEDLIHRFSALTPGEFVVVDDYGRIHSAKLSTAQSLEFESLTKENDGTSHLDAQEDMLISVEINSDFKRPTINIKHMPLHETEPTTTSMDMNAGDIKNTFDIETPWFDECGHITGINTHTITLPYGFKNISLQNSSATTNLTANTTQIVADNVRDTLTFASQNKWIKVASENNTLKIAHALVNDSFAGKKANSQDATPKFGDVFNVPVITTDNAGHITAFETETVKIPGLTYAEDTTENNDIVLNIAYNYNTTTDTGEFVETRGKVDMLTIQDYNITGVASAKLANTDKIHEAFAKLQAQINGMDLAKVGGGTGEYLTDITVVDGVVTANKATLPSVTDTAKAGEFVSSVSETHGQIEISRIAFEPSITIGAGTADAAPSINVTVNTKSGLAQALTIATTGVYGVTKLTDTYSSTSTNLAMTGAAVNKAFETLIATGSTNIDPAKTVKSWKEENGIVSIETQDILIKDANIATDAAINMSKISGLAEALTNTSNALLGNEESTIDSMTIYGLSARINSVIGSEEDTEETPSIAGINKQIKAMKGTEEDTEETLSIAGINKKIEAVKGTEEDTSEQLTIQGLLKKIQELEELVLTYHPVETPPVEDPENGDENGESGGEITP